MKIYAFADEASPNIDEQLIALQENGLQGLEIRNVDGVNVSDISDAKAKEVKEKMAQAGLSVWSIGSPIGKIDIEAGAFAAHIEKFRRTLEIADILGAENIRLFSFYIPKEKSAADYKSAVIDKLSVFCEIAKNSGVALCHENEKGIFGDTAERCVEIHKALPEIKAVFDPANFVQCGVDTKKAWEMLKPYVKYLHIKDAFEDGNVVPAGKGVGNLPHIVNEFAEMGGDSVTIEPHLAVFRGLKELESADSRSVVGELYRYPSSRAAFDAAVSAFKELL